VYAPGTVVGFWLDPECWYYGAGPGPVKPSTHNLAERGHIATDTSVGDLASFIAERVAQRTWPFGGDAPTRDVASSAGATGVCPSRVHRPSPPVCRRPATAGCQRGGLIMTEQW